MSQNPIQELRSQDLNQKVKSVYLGVTALTETKSEAIALLEIVKQLFVADLHIVSPEDAIRGIIAREEAAEHATYLR